MRMNLVLWYDYNKHTGTYDSQMYDRSFIMQNIFAAPTCNVRSLSTGCLKPWTDDSQTEHCFFFKTTTYRITCYVGDGLFASKQSQNGNEGY